MFRKLADHYFTTEKDLTIIANVYDEDSMASYISQSVEFKYLLGNIEKFELVDINKTHTELSKINVFDSESVIPLINSDLTFSILPKGFEIFRLFPIYWTHFERKFLSLLMQKKRNKIKLLMILLLILFRRNLIESGNN